jgi:peptide deformylase
MHKRVIHLKSSFTESQITLINEADSATAMRVLLITNEADSLLLRTQSDDIIFPQDSIIAKNLADRMLKTVNAPQNLGVGIAAPQVGILKNMILVQRFDIDSTPFEAYLNPKITQYTKLKQPCLEGCLSIPNRMDTTRTRAYAILLEYDNLQGEHKIEMIEDFTAVIFQHEIDHLNGILYLDHLDKEIRDAEEKLKFNNHLKE